MKIIIDLRSVSVIKCTYHLQFHDYLSKAYIVCFIGLLRFNSIIVYLQLLLSFVGYSLTLELYL